MWFRRLLLVMSAAACAVAVLLIVFDSLDPGKYYNNPTEPLGTFSHPTSRVAMTASITIAEVVVLYWVLQPWRPVIRLRRLALGFVFFAGWCGLSVMGALGHPPIFIKDHALWMLFVAGLLGVTLVAKAVHRLWERL